MTKFLATAGAIAVLALTSVPAAAATSPSAQANATAKIFKPLTISKTQDLDFGIIVIAGATFPNETVTLPISGPVVCGGGTNLTCSGAPTPAKFHLVGSNNAKVTVNSPAFDLTGPATLTVTPTSTSQTVDLGTSGNSTGVDVFLGGSISVGSATPDGVYSGKWTVTADYQ